MSRAPSRLQTFIGSLEAFYGPLAKPAATDPLEMILWENIAYLADDARRAQAWETFRKHIGTTPEEILAAPRAELMTIARGSSQPIASRRSARSHRSPSTSLAAI
jgi:hypothetical protein